MIMIWTLFAILLSSSSSWAASIYVGPSSTGTGSGDSWTNTKAISTISGTGWVRGNTYYLKEGSYGSVVFGTANSGSTYIYVRKCGSAGQTSHGQGDGTCETAPGFQATEHDGKAIFATWAITSGFWDLSGVTGGGSSNFKSGHGFLLEGYFHPLINMNNYDTDNIYIRHVELNGIDRLNGQGSNVCHSGGIKSVRDDPSGTYFGPGHGVSDTTFEYMYIHDITCPAFHTFGMKNVVIQFSAIARVGYSGYEPLPHTEVWSGVDDSNVTWRWNWLEDISNSGYFCHVNGGSTSNVYIYGNVAYQTGLGTVHASHFVNTGSASTSNWKVYNNTLVGWTSGGSGIRFGSGSGNEVKNNVWALHPASDTIALSGTYTYNSFFSIVHWETHQDLAPALASGESNGQLFTADPFVNSSARNYGLKQGTSPGIALQAPFDIDMFGKRRGADGVWDRGAVEFVGGDASVPAPPANLRVQ